MIFKSCLFSCPQEVKNLTEMLLADYFYGDESDQFSYFRIPRLLITSPRFKGLSTDAKLLYGMLLDRMSLSAKNGWYDEQSRVYIYYTADEIRADMGCGNDKALKLLSELDTKKGVGLIERIKQGQGKPTKIYVKRFTTRELPADTAESSPPCPDTGRGADLDFSDFQTSEKSMSRPRQTRCADLGKADASYPNRNKPEFSYPDPSISPAKPPGTGDRLIERWSLKERVRSQIEYDALCTQYAADDVDALVELIAEIQSSTANAVRVGKEQIPIEIIKERFRQLTQMHVAYILDSLRTTTTQINNIKAYLLTALYNAPTTMGFFYSAQVRHDFGRK